jgi:high frequency lysogenization protein
VTNSLTHWQQLALSLAGVIQATSLVDSLAKTGFAPNNDIETSIRTLFQRQPASTLAVYGNLPALLRGLETLQQLLDNHRNPQQADILRYSLGVLYLQKKLSRHPNMLGTIASRLDKADQQLELFGPTHDNLMANLAEIYSSTLSTFDFRIQVSGDTQQLQQTRIANQIRALLLAAIRSAMLWRQLGGRRWHLLVYRKALNQALSDLIKDAKTGLLQ